MSSIKKGRFIAFEGIDGSGKSTQIRMLADKLRSEGINCYETREPTDSPIGSLVHNIMTGRITADNRAVTALFAADRIDHLTNSVNGIAAQIDKGVTVLTDRYYFSSYAYHSVDIDMNWVIGCNRVSADILKPDVTIYVDIPVKTALERISAGRAFTELYETEERLTKVRENYFKAFEKLSGSENIAIVDGTGTVGEIFERICDIYNAL